MSVRTSDLLVACSRRRWLGSVLAAPWLGELVTAAHAAAGKILVGFAAGGGADQVARLLAEKFSTQLSGSPAFLVENKTGAAGKIAVDALRAAPADGQTLLLAPLVTPVLSQLVFSNPGYDPGKDFSPVGLVGHFQFALAVPANHPAKNFPEFLAWLKANPTKANFGSPSAGSLPHFFGLLLGQAAGVDFVHVAYRGGTPMLNDLIAGQISSGIDTEQELIELHKAGKVRVLASFAAKRTAQLPAVPTLVELGYKNVVGSAWYSLWAPAKTSPARLQELNRALAAIVAQPDVKDKFRQWGLDADPRSPDALEKLRLAEIEKWRPVIAASGFKGD